MHVGPFTVGVPDAANPTPNPTLTLTLTRPGLGVLTSATYVGYSRRLRTAATYFGVWAISYW